MAHEKREGTLARAAEAAQASALLGDSEPMRALRGRIELTRHSRRPARLRRKLSISDGGIVAVHRTGDSVYSEIDGLGRVEMLFDAPDRFRVLELDATVRPNSAPMAR